jgi:iron(III) transport system substrate-binding protein
MHKKLLLLPVVLAAALTAAPVYSQDPKLVEAGKKEGKVTVYGSLETDSAEAVFKVFRQKTGIELEYWRASSTKVMDRALTEYRAGKPGFDVILTNDNPMQIMSR